MNTSVYKINKGINKSIEFQGLKAQYIWYMAGGIIILMMLFSILYIIGLNSYLCLAIILSAGVLMVMKVYSWSNKYGEHGMMKAIARRKVPHVLKSYSRKDFMSMLSINHLPKNEIL